MTIQQKLMNLVMVLLIVVTIIATGLLYGVKDLHAIAENYRSETEEVTAGMSVMDLLRNNSSIVASEEGSNHEGQLRLEIPFYVSAEEITIEEDYVKHQVRIRIPSIDGTYFYDYPMVGSCNHITDLLYDSIKGEGIIDVELDGVYELETEWEDKYLYLGFEDPHELYDYIVVVDAGHGGNDVGARISGTNEKDVNLKIVQGMKELFDNDVQNIGVFYTRLDDRFVSLEDRVALSNDVGADLFISVHNNSTASGRISSINGTEVMYKVSDESGKSKEFADRCLDNLLTKLGSLSKGVVAGDDIYIVRTSNAPVALVEVGFMTNQLERLMLENEEYQHMAAEAMHTAVWEMLYSMEEE